MKLKYVFEIVELGDEVVAVPVGADANRVRSVLKLNKAGKEIIEMLKVETTTEDIINTLQAKYENDRASLEEYVVGFISTLETTELIEA